jgi:ribonuclease BN (tRNA processing enzyme)
VRFDQNGSSFAFSADTGSDWSVSELGSGIGLFMCEASLAAADQDSVQHLTAGQAGAMAADNEVGRLVLTHLVPGVDPAAQVRQAEAAFGRRVELATPHATYDV